MKESLIVFMLLLPGSLLFSQVSVNSTGDPPHGSAKTSVNIQLLYLRSDFVYFSKIFTDLTTDFTDFKSRVKGETMLLTNLSQILLRGCLKRPSWK